MRQGLTASRGLNELRQRVAVWREEHGGRGSKIPAELWNDAVRVARVDGLWRTAQALRFNCERLKERVDRADGTKGQATTHGDIAGASESDRAAELTRAKQRRGARRLGRAGKRYVTEMALTSGDGRSDGNGRSRFVALEMGALGGGPRTVIELVGRHGDRMRVEVTGGVNLAGLCETFWRRQP